MGICSSSEPLAEENNVSKVLDKQIANTAAADAQINKLLLLGAGASGKSTLFKQMITIYGKGFSEADRRTFKSNIYNNVVISIQTLCKESEKYGKISPTNADCIAPIMQLDPEESRITEDVAKVIARLWRDEGILRTYENRSRFQLNDSAAYFFSRLEQIGSVDYVPDLQDTLRCRVPTTGIVEYSFEIDSSLFKLLDLGGQRSERKKWVHCFENVTAVIFVAALNEYDLVLYEDEQMNRMREALELFEGIVNNEWFQNTAMILFLNKSDLFSEKIAKVPLSEYFPQFTGDCLDFKATSEWIQSQFRARVHDEQKNVFTHITCATDRNNVYMVFNSVKEIIIKQGMARAGLG